MFVTPFGNSTPTSIINCLAQFCILSTCALVKLLQIAGHIFSKLNLIVEYFSYKGTDVNLFHKRSKNPYQKRRSSVQTPFLRSSLVTMGTVLREGLSPRSGVTHLFGLSTTAAKKEEVVTVAKEVPRPDLKLTLLTELQLLRQRLEDAEDRLSQHPQLPMGDDGILMCSQRLIRLDVRTASPTCPLQPQQSALPLVSQGAFVLSERDPLFSSAKGVEQDGPASALERSNKRRGIKCSRLNRSYQILSTDG